jgi:HAD superfamily hydrolase (TIGR01509 family)
MNKPVLKAVIFDLDGTLIDSEPIYYLADQAFLAARGLVLPAAFWESVPGMGSRNFLLLLQARYGLVGDIEQLLAEKNELYRSMARHSLRFFPEPVRFLAEAKAGGLTTAIASGSSCDIIRDSLIWTGLSTDCVDMIVSADEVLAGKPAPDVFLETCRRLDVHPANCLVLEDSRAGVLAAQAAGMVCVALPDKALPGPDPVYSQAGIVYTQGMAEFTSQSLWEKLEGYFEMTGRIAVG